MAAVRRWLESRHVYTQNEWLEACINFVQEDNEERQLTPVQLNELVYEQWLMAEIQESSLPRLPEGLANTDICKLEGYFNLQINSILNIGESAYSQIQKMKGQDDPEELNWKTNPSEPKIKPSRMLLLELTDGTQTLFGMEYQQIPGLKVATPPGTKIQVSGHTTCRLGTLLLTASNVKVLGGSVQLLEGNSFWNVLHQAIGQDPPEQPGLIKTEAISNEEPNVDHVSIQNNTASDVAICNNQRPFIKTEAQPTHASSSAGLASNNQRGNKGNFSECGGRSKQQGQKGNRTIKGVVPANSSSNNIKMAKVSNQECFDDGDDIIAAMADEDYFAGIDEDFDMEQINQLELGMQNTNRTVTGKRITNSNTDISENYDLEMLCDDIDDDDEIFEDDFITDDLPQEDDECMEIKPLHRRSCNKDTMEMSHQSKKAKVFNSSSVEFSNQFREPNISCLNTSSSRTATEANFTRRKDGSTHNTKPNVKNFNFPLCSDLIKTEPCSKPSTSGTLKLSSTKGKGLTKSNAHSATTPPFPQSSNIQKDVPNTKHITPAVDHANQPLYNLDRCSHESNPFEAQVTDLECDPAPFEYLSHILKSHTVSEESIVRVKAYVATIVSRSQPMSPNWNVTVKLNDGTGTVDADLSDKVLTELLEFPVDEFQREMQEAIKTRNPASCQRLHKRTELFQRNLASTSCLMDLQFSPDTPRPRVLHLTQPTSMDVSEMVRHVSALL